MGIGRGLVDRKRSVIVQVDAQRGQVDQSTIAGKRVGRVVEQTRLQRAQRAVAGEGPLRVGGRIHGELGVENSNHGVVGAHECIDCCRGLGGIRSHGQLHRRGRVGGGQT